MWVVNGLYGISSGVNIYIGLDESYCYAAALSYFLMAKYLKNSRCLV